MKIKFSSLFIAFALVTGIAHSQAFAGTSPAQQVIENFLSTIRSMQFPIQDTSKHSALVKQAHSALDLESMSKKALGDHINEASSEEQKQFFELMWQLIEHVAYPKSSRFIGNYTITYPEIKKVANGVEVHSLIRQEAKALDAKVIYHLYQNEGSWKVDDIILDDVSIIEDLHYQFDQLVTESKFSGLLDKMREKLAQAKKENGVA